MGAVGSGQAEFPDGPVEPISDVFLGPDPGILGDPQPLRVLLPRGVGRLQNLVHLLIRGRGQGRNLEARETTTH